MSFPHIESLLLHALRESKIRGVRPAIVVNNKDGEGNPGYRIKLMFPWLNEQETTFWARIATPMGGHDRGTYVLPEIDDQVLVVFEHGDINRPIVIGALWSKKQEPVEVNQSGKNNTKLIKSRCGHRIIFDDKEGAEKITIVDKTKKNKIVLDSVNKIVKIESDGDIEVIAKTNVIMHSNALKIGTSEGVTGKGASLLTHSAKTFGLKATRAITIGGGNTTINVSNAAACSVSSSGAGELGGATMEQPKAQVEAKDRGGGASSSGGGGDASAGASGSGTNSSGTRPGDTPGSIPTPTDAPIADDRGAASGVSMNACSEAPPVVERSAEAPPPAIALVERSAPSLLGGIDPHQIEVRIVNPFGRPVRGTDVTLRLPDGSTKHGATAPDGLLRFSYLEQTGTCTVVLNDFEDAQDRTAVTEGALPYRAGGVAAAVGQRSTVEVPPRTYRGRLLGMLFDSDKSFLVPHAMRSIRELVEYHAEHPDAEVLVVGHTDVQGSRAYNLLLSVERAESVAAFLTDDVDAWLRRYRRMRVSTTWGVIEDQHMLTALGELTGRATSAAGPAYHKAVRAFQDRHGLKASGVADEGTRRELIRLYMAQDGTSLPPVLIRTHGCGPFHPAVQTRAGASERRNRRVEIFLFEGGVDPPPRTPCPSGGCSEYRTWQRRAVETLDFGQPPGQLKVLAVDHAGQPVPTARLHLEGEALHEATTDGHGRATFADLIPGDYRVAARCEGFAPAHLQVTVLPGGGVASTRTTKLSLDKTGGITGFVKEEGSLWNVNVIAGAKVKLSKKAGKLSKSATASLIGFSFSDLPPGAYVLECTHAGFRPTKAHVTIEAAKTLTVDVWLDRITLEAFIKFEAWSVATRTYVPIDNLNVDACNVDAPGRSTTLDTQRTNADGVAHFQLTKVQRSAGQAINLSFAAKPGGRRISEVTFPKTWSTAGWKSVDARVDGLQVAFTGSTLGTAANPIVFRIGLDVHLRIVYVPEHPDLKVAPVPPGVTVVLRMGDPLGVFHPEVDRFVTDAWGEVHGLTFGVQPGESLRVQVLGEIKNSDIGLEKTTFQGFPAWTNATKGPDAKPFTNVHASSLGTLDAPLLLTGSERRAAAMYIFKVLSELSQFLYIITNREWTGIPNLKIYPHSISGISYSFPVGDVNIVEEAFFDRRTILHELAHQIMWQQSGITSFEVGCLWVNDGLRLKHRRNLLAHRASHALIEGWADFISDILTGYREPMDGKPEMTLLDGSLDGTKIDLRARPGLGARCEGAFTNGLISVYEKFIKGRVLKASENGSVDEPWMSDRDVRKRWKSAIWDPLTSLRPKKPPTTTDFLDEIKRLNPDHWQTIEPGLRKWNLLKSAK